jgi:hypothetical protein
MRAQRWRCPSDIRPPRAWQGRRPPVLQLHPSRHVVALVNPVQCATRSEIHFLRFGGRAWRRRIGGADRSRYLVGVPSGLACRRRLAGFLSEKQSESQAANVYHPCRLLLTDLLARSRSRRSRDTMGCLRRVSSPQVVLRPGSNDEFNRPWRGGLPVPGGRPCLHRASCSVLGGTPATF